MIDYKKYLSMIKTGLIFILFVGVCPALAQASDCVSAQQNLDKTRAKWDKAGTEYDQARDTVAKVWDAWEKSFWGWRRAGQKQKKSARAALGKTVEEIDKAHNAEAKARETYQKAKAEFNAQWAEADKLCKSN